MLYNKAVGNIITEVNIMVVTKETVIGELLSVDINTAEVLMEMGMHCVGCPSSIGEMWTSLWTGSTPISRRIKRGRTSGRGR